MRSGARNRRTLSCLLLLLIGVPAGAMAQDAPAASAAADDGVLTLEEALRLARANNPAVRRAANEVERASAGERRGWGAYLPQLSGTLSFGEGEITSTTATDDFGEPVTRENPLTSASASAFGQLDASLVLFDGFRRLNQLQAARAGSRAAVAGLDVESVRIEAEVRRRYYGAIGARRFIELEERLLAAAEERFDATQAMVDAGRRPPQDALGAEVEVARQQIELDRARGDLINRKVLLAEVIGLDGSVEFEVEGDFPPLFDPSTLDAEALIATALEIHPRVRRGREALGQAENRADAARALRWPSIRLGASLNRNISVAERAQIPDFPWNQRFSVGLSASVPIFSGFQTSEQIANASAARANARESLREARLAVEREVRIALTNIANAYQAVQLAERAAELSRERLDVAQEGFRRGVVDFTALQQLIDRTAQTERAAVSARMNWAEALTSLDAAVGRRVRP
ncbi:MAG: TolC family protein [Gemmatimonadota bacterium]